MRSKLTELGEILLGAAWWGSSYAWGIALSIVLIGAPLILANLLVEVFDALSATIALALGVVGAYALGLPPWHAEGRWSLPLLIGATATSVVAWDLIHGSADTGTLLVALAVAALGWPIRNAVTRRTPA